MTQVATKKKTASRVEIRYEWRSRGLKGDPQIVGEELERIRIENGGTLSSRMIVEAARPEGSVLHGYFQWDVQKAAEAHWISQAGTLRSNINMIQVRIKGGAREEMPAAPAFVRIDPTSRTQTTGYGATRELKIDNAALPALRDAVASLRGWRARCMELAPLRQAFARTLDAIEADIEDLARVNPGAVGTPA